MNAIEKRLNSSIKNEEINVLLDKIDKMINRLELAATNVNKKNVLK